MYKLTPTGWQLLTQKLVTGRGYAVAIPIPTSICLPEVKETSCVLMVGGRNSWGPYMNDAEIVSTKANLSSLLKYYYIYYLLLLEIYNFVFF
jgi:hypothetical protein